MNLILYNFRANCDKNAWKKYFSLVYFEFWFFSGFNRNQRQKRVWLIKSHFFFRIFDIIGFKVIQNSVNFQKECSILSLKDKMTKNGRKTNFLNKILKDFVCIFSIFSILNAIEAGQKSNWKNHLLSFSPLNIKMYVHHQAFPTQ